MPDKEQSSRNFLIAVVLLTLGYTGVWIPLVGHALSEDLHSHIILVPFITIWLLRGERQNLPQTRRRALPGAGLFVILAGGLLIWAWTSKSGNGAELSLNDRLSVYTLSYLCALFALCLAFRGWAWVGKCAFPLFFLLFMIPLPDAMVVRLEHFLMKFSADATDGLFSAFQIPNIRDGQSFQLPGMSLVVAQECSGIRSTWVLFMTSLLAAHMFLRSNLLRILFVLLIFPLGILRNGVRILVIGWLCVEKGPHMVDSWIHRQGGPVFFAASLVPLLLILWGFWLFERWQDKSREGSRPSEDAPSDFNTGDEAV